MAFTENSCTIACTPWGLEVKKCLLDFNMKQDDLVKVLNDAGYEITKGQLSALLRGIGASNKRDIIEEISGYLDIPLE